MTLTVNERLLLRVPHRVYREARVKFWFFEHDPQDTTVGGELGGIYSDAHTGGAYQEPFVSNNAATAGYPLIVVDPPVALIRPDEPLTLSAYAYLYDHLETQLNALNIQWSKVGASQCILSHTFGPTCTVTPTGGEDSEIVVRVTYTRTVSTGGTTWTYTSHRDIPIGVSTKGYRTISGQITISEAFGQDASATLEIAGDTTGVELLQGRMVLVHVDTYYDGVLTNISGDGSARPQNLFYGRVPWFQSSRDHQDRKITQIPLQSAIERVNSERMWVNNDSKDYDWDEVNQEQMIYFVGEAASGTDPVTLADQVQHVIGTDLDMTYARASFYLAGFANIGQDHNVIIAGDAQEFYDARQPIGGLWGMVKGPVTAILFRPYCDAEGNLKLLPDPAVRGDEYWTTNDALFVSTDPLDEAFAVGERRIAAFPAYHSSGVRWDGLVLEGVDDNTDPVYATAGNVKSQHVVNEEYKGYALRDDAVESDWAQNLLDLVNRTWDVTVTLPCWGRVLRLGSFAYVDFKSDQKGVPDATGMAYIDWIQHRIDIGRNMQWTDARFVKLTGGLSS
jgi:hypothetical protein